MRDTLSGKEKKGFLARKPCSQLSVACSIYIKKKKKIHVAIRLLYHVVISLCCSFTRPEREQCTDENTKIQHFLN